MTLGLILFGSLIGGAAGLWMMGKLPLRRRPRTGPPEEPASNIFLFHGDDLVDATPSALALFENGPPVAGDRARLCALLDPHFRDLSWRLDALAPGGRMSIPGVDAQMRLEAERSGDALRLTLIDARPVSGPSSSAALWHEELSALRLACDGSPALIWRETPDGAVRWANASYLAALSRQNPERPLTWPLPHLFAGSSQLPRTPGHVRRLSVALAPEQETRWFDCHTIAAGDDLLCYALPADSVVRAETRMRDMVQTLTKTFAHLPTGLAVFDSQRALVLFNPTLADMTGLQPTALARKPSLFEFLDLLRERRCIPEPKNYKAWRARMAELEAAASHGPHVETWSLPGGQTYRVTGRPHPDGALAFLFEDISSEIALTRQFRAELETVQAVIDTLQEAIVVFSPSGGLIASNAAYDEMWQTEPVAGLECDTLIEATRLWQGKTAPTPVWGDLRDFVQRKTERSDWTADVCRADGTVLHCRIQPIAGQATLVGFTPSSVVALPGVEPRTLPTASARPARRAGA